jgi:hypothetical protein
MGKFQKTTRDHEETVRSEEAAIFVSQTRTSFESWFELLLLLADAECLR